MLPAINRKKSTVFQRILFLYHDTKIGHHRVISRGREILYSVWEGYSEEAFSARGEFRPRQTRQLPRAVDLKGRLLSCQSY